MASLNILVIKNIHHALICSCNNTNNAICDQIFESFKNSRISKNTGLKYSNKLMLDSSYVKFALDVE